MISESQAQLYCCEPIENIENYEAAVADQTQLWLCHHRLGVRDGVTVTDELIATGRYENRPASELIFVTYSQHNKLHHDRSSKAAKAMNAKLTFEQRSKGGTKSVKIMHAKLTREQRVKGGKKGMAKMTREQHVKGGKARAAKMTFEQRSKAGKMNKGMFYWNNGVINKRAKECPGDGWVRGMVRRSLSSWPANSSPL